MRALATILVILALSVILLATKIEALTVEVTQEVPCLNVFGTPAMGCYTPHDETIYLSFDLIGTPMFMHVFWHEYGHHLYGADEKIAEEFAESMIAKVDRMGYN